MKINSFKRIIRVLALLAVLVGCAAQMHTSRMNSVKEAIVKKGTLDIGFLEKTIYNRSGDIDGSADLIDLLELGAMYPLVKDYQNSNTILESAYVKYTKREERAKLNARNTTTDFLDILIGEGSGEYEMASYEKIYIHNIKATNFLMMGNLNAARVEVQRSINCNRRIREYAQFKAAQIAKEKTSVKQKAKKEKIGNLDMDAEVGKLTKKAGLDGEQQQAIRNIRNSYENGYTYLLSALVFALNQEWENARPQLKNADALTDNRYVKRLYRDFKNNPASLTSKTNVYIFSQVGFAPYKENFQVPFYNPVSKTLTHFSLAKIQTTRTGVSTINIVDGSSTVNDRMEALADLDLLALKQYDEDLVANITKATLRVVSQTIKDKAILDETTKKGKNTALFQIEQILLSGMNQVLYKTDIRAWNLAPKRVLFYCGTFGTSPITLTVRSTTGQTAERKVDIDPERLNIVSVRCLGQKMFVNHQTFDRGQR
ncbi:uncharacterized protein Dvar_52830 [Desulfosarcina variabilis str. Montpellier]